MTRAVLGDVDELVELIALASHVVRPTLTLDLVRDPDDNRVLEAAITGSADCIVTGDADLLDLHAVEGVRILRTDQGKGRKPGGGWRSLP